MDDLIKLIKSKLQAHFIHAKIVVQPNSIKGINLKIVDESFQEDFITREHLVFSFLESENVINDRSIFSFLELLTPEEEELFGTPLQDFEPSSLPFWNNAVAKRAGKRNIEFREDQSYDNPPIISFYSYKGGVGRSTSLVATARTLAKRGKMVIAIDMDLEAPGLTELLSARLQTERNKGGLVELLNRLENQETLDIRSYLVESEQNLYLLPAGELNSYYLSQLGTINLNRYYRLETNPILTLFKKLQSLEPKPDFILVDSRTGLTDISAPLLFNLSDMSVVVFSPTNQHELGFDLLVKGILNSKNLRNLTTELRFVQSMIPPSDKDSKVIQNRGLEWVKDYVEEISNIRNENGQNPLDLVAEDIITKVFYNEEIAYSNNMLDDKLLPAYQGVADWIENLTTDLGESLFASEGISLIDYKTDLLKDVKIQSGIAEDQPNLPEIYVKTSAYRKAIEPITSLILGRKGTGKSALIRMLQEHFGEDGITIRHSRPNKDNYHLPKDDLRYIEDILPETNWELYWGLFVLLKIIEKKNDVLGVVADEQIEDFVKKCLKNQSRLELIKSLEQVLPSPLLSARLHEIYRRINNYLERPLGLLWDGLDRDFGIEQEQRVRRDKLIIGLFDFWNMIQTHINIQVKISIRKDIWDNLIFENKSHFYGRTVTLEWAKIEDYYKTLLKQVYEGSIKQFLKQKYYETYKNNLIDEVDHWSEEQVIFCFNALVSERMKGGKTTYTKNWVWLRLADGKGNHSPRLLFQLFDQALTLETEINVHSPYDRSLIRPRMLIEAFPNVSEEALKSLLEEYEELRTIQDAVSGKLAPFDASSLSVNFESDLFETAVEAGLLVIYEKDSEGDPIRLTVPDLYLKGLNMTRKGQA
ncbi:P-loop ATPase, Sll1717 family [Paenibacillus sp. MMS20-IR301]|uniref:tyrosine-protein kinase family protein n=1 Tax=Paenibacillus sp. MMS20-IR301 TaxID=2895946 RepID=UPI0028E6403C|nr:AAA family ATPase [Paenibacillus sp. MMS20-IR301]WNS41937.1 AAA family ATPase [Paenibacillus sp. MMS20-IR301]